MEINIGLEAIDSLRDESDAVFIRLAQAANASFLISGDKHLLELRDILPQIQIISLAEFVERIDSNRNST